MTKRLRRAIVCAFLIVASPATHARAADDRRIEVGGGLGVVGSWWAGPFPGGDVRVSVPVSARGDVEALVALSGPSLDADGTLGFYGVQFKQRLRKGSTPTVEPFLTYGGIGIFYRDGHESMVTPPFIGLVGAGVQRRVNRRLAVRVEAQAVIAFIFPVGVRVAAGVSVPMGGPRTISR